MYEFLQRTESLRKILKKNQALNRLSRLSGQFVLWANHFRRNVVKQIDGIMFNLDLNEGIDSSIYMSGCFEREVTDAITVLTKPGNTVCDIGANIGCHTLRFSKLVGKEGRVFAFEPTAYAYEKIYSNIALNHSFSSNVILEKMIISDTSAEKQTIQFKSSWLLYGSQKPIAREVVDSITLDEYVQYHEIGKIDILKVDVDGFETQVLDGARQTIMRDKPIIFLELNDTDTVNDLIERFFNLGYFFVTEKAYARLTSQTKVVDLLNKQPLNSTGYRAINFILIHDLGDYYRLIGKETISLQN